MMNIRWMVVATALTLIFAACDDGTGIGVADLEGTWLATVYEFTDNADSLSVVDVVQRDAASFSLTVDADGIASTLFDDGVGGSSSDSGTLNSEGTVLTLGGSPFEALRDGAVLTLSYADATFDFGAGSISATLRIVMNRQ